MTASRAAACAFLILLSTSAVLSAKGITTRVTIAGGDLASPIVLADPVLLQRFNVWAGPGASVNGIEQQEGFIIDWRAGPVAERPTAVRPYEVSFFVRYPNRRDEQLAYVVLYARDPSGGYVYLPGPGDERYRLNTRAIRRGREGQWFRATATWREAVEAHLLRAQPDTHPSGDSRIAGRVLTESGEGVGGAQVSALLFTAAPEAAARYSAATGPDGGYVIEHLPKGQYRIFAEKPGFSNVLVQPGRMEGGRMVELEASSSATGMDLVLRRAGSLSGRVTRPDGTPVEKARVVTQIRLPSGRMLGTGPGAVTDAAGRYRLDGVPPGTYVVTAIYSKMHEMLGKAVPHEFQDWARTFHGSTSDVERATQIAVQGGKHLENIDITLQPDERYRVSGIVVADGGAAVRNVRVEYSSAGGTSGVVTRVPDDGRFTVGGVTGPVTILATADTDAGMQIGMAQLNVSSSLDDMRVTIGPPARVRGRIVFQGGPPPQDEPLQVQLATDWFRPRPNDERPDAAVVRDGRFTIENVIGERRVVVLGLMPQWEVKAIRRGGRVLADGRLTLAAGQVVDDLEIVIAPRL